MKKWGCLTLDLEEDNGGISKSLRYDSFGIFAELLSRLKKKSVPLTTFVAGNLLENQGELLRPLISEEFHSHGYWHPPIAEANRPDVRRDNILRGLAAFKTYFGRDAVGYRAPYGFLSSADFDLLAQQGVKFDSSFFPGIHVSGFNYFRSDRPFFDAATGILEIPMSAFPVARFPYSFSYMNLLGQKLFQWPLRRGYYRSPVVFDFHLHDLESPFGGENVSPLWKLVYRKQHFVESWKKMKDLIDSFRSSGGEFTTLNALHDQLRKERLP